MIDEWLRQQVLDGVIAGDLTAADASVALGRSVRQVRRLLAAYRAKGASSLVHGNRGRAPAHALDPTVAAQVRKALGGAYAGCNDVHLAELLAEREGITVSRSTVRRLRLVEDARVRRRAPAHRRRRARRERAGMLLQLDGSPHAWLEDRGPRLTLLAAIDDATGMIPAALFRPQEDAAGYLELLHRIASGPGVPEAVYHDRHSIFLVHPGSRASLDEHLAGKRAPTHVGRALRELDIVSIPAGSPQAKGRVERLFATLQDRLVSELRLAGAATLTEAEAVLQAYLPRFNARFAVPAADPHPAWRGVPPGIDPWQACAFRYLRRVGGDAIVAFAGQRLALTPDARLGLTPRVEVREHLVGSLSVWNGYRRLAWQPAPAEAPLLRARGLDRGNRPLSAPAVAPPACDPWDDPDRERLSAGRETAAPATPRRTTPAAGHPWRRSSQSG